MSRRRREELPLFLDDEQMSLPTDGTVVETPADTLFRLAVAEPFLMQEWQSALEDWNTVRGSRDFAAALVDPWGKEVAQRAFVVAYEIFGTISRAARRLGIPPQMVYRWTATDAQFKDAVRVAELGIADRIQERGLVRALSPMAEMDSASSAIANNLLKALRPLQFRDGAPLAQPNVPSASIDMGEGNPNPYLTALAPPSTEQPA